MILILTPETETRLRTIAEERGIDPGQLHEDFLKQALVSAEADSKEIQETLAGLDESMEAFAASRWITSEKLSQRMTARLAKARLEVAER